MSANVRSGGPNDWRWFFGAWRVQHRKLRGRLVGSNTWDEFDGRCSCWETMAGLGNVDDNLLNAPDGPYRAMTVRAFDPDQRQWGIWWLDGRSPSVIGAPVFGAFDAGVGEFFGDDTWADRPIKVRFQWTRTLSRTPRWEQAFSADGGQTWETNWTMDFSPVEP